MDYDYDEREPVEDPESWWLTLHSIALVADLQDKGLIEGPYQAHLDKIKTEILFVETTMGYTRPDHEEMVETAMKMLRLMGLKEEHSEDFEYLLRNEAEVII